ncbi:hypothetical protein N7530_012054 [Penicillium desertorum]|uniref:Translation initiation factor eIF2B subunit delta n=1 Tax=Penicillium desertorum TaxID=1303715 RepID=A0A9X0BG89_9EURO|nr:hypothetical protein N7530_012054 [Penicillium desertorum]
MNRKLGLRRCVGRLWHHFFFHKMVEPSNPAPTAPVSPPVSSTPEQATLATENPPQTLPIRDSKPTQPTGDAPASTDGATDKPLTAAELKKKAKADKAARRIRQKLEREGNTTGSTAPTPSVGAQPRQPNTPKKDAAGTGSAQKGPRAPPPRRGSGPVAQTGSVLVEQKKKKDDKKVAVFGHLYGQQRRVTVGGATKEVHPAILALGMQLVDYTICGSSARCVATLLAFKRVIESYTTPMGTSLARHLTTHLSSQITYLSTCRPLSISQGNAIRALKLFIAGIDPSTPEASAKISLCEYIDSFIREKITVADQVIADSAAQKVQDGDVIVTFAGSSIVKHTLLLAHNQGKRFRVSIIDSRPLFEGKSLARDLANSGLDVQYSLVHSITHAVKDATKVFLGAHAMTSNGGLYSRVGTALVAISPTASPSTASSSTRLPMPTSSYPWTPPVSLAVPTPDTHAPPAPENKKGGNRTPAPESPVIPHKTSSSPLADWHNTPNLQLLNIMYDVTPAEYVDMVITEMGSLPPSAVPIVHRMVTNL